MSTITGNAAAATKGIRRGPIIAALLIGAFVALLNQTLLNVALPSIMDDLKIATNTAQWLTTGFMLVNGVLIPISAFLVEKFTTRQLFITAMSLFSLGTLVCGIGTGFEMIMVGRVIQAVGAGILMPLMNIVFLRIFPIEERGKAMGLMAVAMIFAPAVGPTLSGWVVQNYSWRVLFFIVLPLAILSTLLGMKTMQNVGQTTSPKLDKTGVILSTIGFGGLLYGFSDAGTDGWGSATVITCLIVGVIALALFVWRELKAETPLLEFRIFRYNMYSLTTLINIIITMALYSGMILLPIYLQTIRGFTPMESGLMLLPGAILMGIMSPITGIIFDKIGARWLSVVGLIITVITTWQFSQLTDSTTYTHMIITYTVRMLGMSMLSMPIVTAGLNQLPQRLSSHGTAMSNTLRTVGGALGMALFVSLMTNKTKSTITDTLMSGTVSLNDKAAMLKLTQEATISGVTHAFNIATWITVVALVLAFFIKKTSPQPDFLKTEEVQPQQDNQ
ncbi:MULTISPECIES: DHA2 family efflux MFS transporter permease subunit [Paenibacillus]|jgi:EmrB/QacA subfamily drug resistance transporter|uniref:MFS transporter n=1 Tax=Paenibacillus odorifer TaxID=189426 RepID=A0ABX3GKF7_9BACL|nr:MULTISPECIES: DHA2 family efflux MFS transporter permease subunit [Paenibacillus]MDH6429133.1 EmrB/QacA subfamily drug resistance transporter [Paenibacillus sp. PastH-4]MDH6445339.1 EmrB/QacA subfamily drug resistance transporter [Paenibacillus sp. PastF-4]MDH6529228.1 EmrB/QacA subfamily drug resistance transporter [Paenibacillus sp. PastH-3]MEC0129602.1 DHA2 family efflux MFS transporter permease subunit [Paenibacillus odorifer]MEC0223391.1 DHA2 family efflux MFS transporter permease subu